MIVPPNLWYHQHFNTGTTPARYLAFKAEGVSIRNAQGVPKAWISKRARRRSDRLRRRVAADPAVVRGGAGHARPERRAWTRRTPRSLPTCRQRETQSRDGRRCRTSMTTERRRRRRLLVALAAAALALPLAGAAQVKPGATAADVALVHRRRSPCRSSSTARRRKARSPSTRPRRPTTSTCWSTAFEKKYGVKGSRLARRIGEYRQARAAGEPREPVHGRHARDQRSGARVAASRKRAASG